jgi:hypothetical protein
MTDMPLSIALAFAAIVLWPLIKVIAAIAGRPRWKQVRALEEALRNDAAYADPEDQAIIAREARDARGNPIFLLMPPVVFFGGLAFAISEISGWSDVFSDINDAQKSIERLYMSVGGSRELARDRRFRSLVDVSFELSFLAYPVCSILTLLSLVLVAPLIIICGGLKSSVRLVAVRVLRTSAAATIVFGRGLGAPRGV